MGEAPESSDRGDSESSSSSRGQGDTGGLEQGLRTRICSKGLAPPPSVSMGAVLGLQSTSMGAGLWIGPWMGLWMGPWLGLWIGPWMGLGWSPSTGSGGALGLEAGLWTGLRSGEGGRGLT